VKDATTGSLLLKAALIMFHHLQGTHNSKTMAATVLRLIDHANITANVCVLIDGDLIMA
jgi:hypothetical protein